MRETMLLPKNQSQSSRRKAHAPVAANWPPWLASLLLGVILVATILVYLPALGGSLIWDDDANITPPELRSLGGVYRIWFEPGATAQYYPLLHTVFWIEHKIWGDASAGYHIASLLWHLVAVVLVYFIVQRLQIPGAILAAAIFALHPVMVESVAWIAEQKNTLSTVFYLAALLVYLDFDQSRGGVRYGAAFGLFVAALLCKTATVTLPAALLVIFWWQRGSISWRRDVAPLVPFFAVAAAAGCMTAWVEWRIVGAAGEEFELTLVERFLLAGRAVWFYLSKLFWPSWLILIYPRWDIDPTVWWQWIFPLVVIAVTVFLWLLRRRTRAPLAAWLYYCGTLLPVLGFLNVYFFRYSYVADHFQYVASLGMIVPLASATSYGLERLALPARSAGAALVVTVIGVLAALTALQSRMYADSITLYQATLKRNPTSWMAHNNLGLELAANGHQKEAIEHYRSALENMPKYAEIHNNLGLALTQAGRAPEAIEHLQQALRLQPNYVEAHNNLGLALTQLGNAPEAIKHTKRAIELRPSYSEAHNNLANALLAAGRSSEAIEEFRAALDLKPDDAIVQNNLVTTLTKSGRFPEAREQAEKGLQLRPDSADAHYSLGLALIGTGDVNGAIQHISEALRLHPNFAEAHNNLGELLRRTGRPQEAIKHYQETLQLNPSFRSARNNLGIALAETGDMPRAIEQFHLALQLNPDDANAHGNLGTALVATGKSDEAMKYFEEAVRLRPDSAIARNRLGEALRQSDRTEEAIKHFRAAITSSPNFLPAYSNLVQALTLANKSDEALAIAEKGLEIGRSTGQETAAGQLEEWLVHLQTERRREQEAQIPIEPSQSAPRP
jgi:tetratricopeptide (TPR) repeat protein